MLKQLGRILVILLVISAVAGIIYFAVQGGSATSAAGSVAQGFRGEGGHDEGGASLGGLVGVIGNIGLVGIMTLIITALGQVFSSKPGKTNRPQTTNL